MNTSNSKVRSAPIIALFLLAACSLGAVSAPPIPNSDFPRDPVAVGGIMDASAIAKAFADAPQSPTGGPCISEPTFGALYPRNFTPPIVEWVPAVNQNVFELRWHLANQSHDLVVYTDQLNFTLPDATWKALVEHSQDRDITLSIRGAALVEGEVVGSVFAGSTGSVRIAPADASGAIVYWTTSNGSALKGFRVGDKQVRTVLSPKMITAAGKPTRCIGCHTSSPDGALAFFGRADPQFGVDARQINGTGSPPSTSDVTPNALANLSRTDQDLPTLSKAHYSPSDAVVLTTLYHPDTGNKWELVWTDLHATAGGWGILKRNGDPRGATHAAWGHDGNTVVYMSTNAIASARADRGDSDLWAVPYNGHNGGQAAPLPGANRPDSNQYYPSYSPRDTFLAFDRNPRGSQMYDSPTGEIWVLTVASGDPAVRTPANDPPACTGQVSPGLTNSWPRWAPTVWTEGGRNYYWLIFSSKRRNGPLGMPIPQLFMSSIVTRSEPGGEVLESITPAIYISTQPANESNHTPAWDDFLIPAG